MYKLIGTDFDGTLLDDYSKVSDDNKRYLKEARSKGIKIVGVTARNLESAKSVVDLDLFDYIILNNGSNTYDVEKKETFFNHEIPKDIAKRITSFAEPFAHQYDYSTYKEYNIYKNFINKHLSFIKEVQGVDDVNDPISKINIFIKKGVDIYILKDLLISEFSELNIGIMQDSNNERKWIVITPKNMNKKESLKKLGEKLDIKLDEMVFFGDGLNDVEVIEAVGMGVAMENALDEVKQKAKTYTKNNNSSGIAYFIKSGIL